MAAYDFDVLVIGSGPAGESAALNAVKHGRTAAIIEDQALVGGRCTHKGTIPSKALRHAVKQLMRFNTNKLFRDIGHSRRVPYPTVLSAAASVIERQVEMRSKFYLRNECCAARPTFSMHTR
jgi:NAD(P) transhydrogenase